jgi:hypothetical protein
LNSVSKSYRCWVLVDKIGEFDAAGINLKIH